MEYSIKSGRTKQLAAWRSCAILFSVIVNGVSSLAACAGEVTSLDSYQAGSVPAAVVDVIKKHSRDTEKLAKEHHFDEANEICLQDIELVRKRLGPDHPLIITPLIRLADIARADHKYAESAKYLVEVEARQRRLCGLDSPDANETFAIYLEQLQKMGQQRQAADLARQRVTALATIHSGISDYAKARLSFFLALSPATDKPDSIRLAREAAQHAVTVKCNDREGMIKILVSISDYLESIEQMDAVPKVLARIIELRGPRRSIHDRRIRVCYERLKLAPPF